MSNNYTCIIIDDEHDAIELLTDRLTKLFKNIIIVNTYTYWEDALTALRELNPDLLLIDISMPGKNSIELLLEQFKHFNSDIKFSKREKLVRCMSRQQSIKAGQPLTQKEITTLIDELFACSIPNTTPNGNPTYIEFKDDYLERMFGR